MTSTTTNQPKTANSGGIGMKLKGGVQVAKGLGDSVRGTAMGAMDTVEHRDSSVNDEIARRGRREIEEGISMIKGRPVDTTAIGSHNATNQNGPANSLQGWGSGINGGNANATTNSAGFPPPKGAEYAQNSTTASNMKTDLGRGPNAYSGNDQQQQPPSYPAPGGPPPQDHKAGMSSMNPTEMGNRPTNSMAGQDGYQQRQDADQLR